MNFPLLEPSALSSSALSSSALSTSALNTSALIDKMFEDVLQHADKEDEDGEKVSDEEKNYNNSSGLETEEESEPDTVESNPSSQENSEMCEENKETFDGSSAVDEVQELQPADKAEGEMEQKKDNTSMGAEEDFLTLPPRFILSPLSKSMEAVVTPMVLF